MFFKNMKWAMLWALLILILCGIPGRDIPHISFLELLSFDKFVHASIFAILIILTIRGLFLQTTFLKLQTSAKPFSFIFCVLYGGFLEIMQGAIFIERSADVYDFIANTLGCVMGLLLYNWIVKRMKSSK